MQEAVSSGLFVQMSLAVGPLESAGAHAAGNKTKLGPSLKNMDHFHQGFFFKIRFHYKLKKA